MYYIVDSSSTSLNNLCVQPTEGNGELQSFLLMSSADLQTELKRHKELSESSSCPVFPPFT